MRGMRARRRICPHGRETISRTHEQITTWTSWLFGDSKILYAPFRRLPLRSSDGALTGERLAVLMSVFDEAEQCGDGIGGFTCGSRGCERATVDT